MLTSDSPFKLKSWVQVRNNVTGWHQQFAGKVGKVVMVGIDNYNQFVFDLEIDGTKVSSFRVQHLATTLQTLLMNRS
jgi:hypothetical protein